MNVLGRTQSAVIGREWFGVACIAASPSFLSADYDRVWIGGWIWGALNALACALLLGGRAAPSPYLHRFARFVAIGAVTHLAVWLVTRWEPVVEPTFPMLGVLAAWMMRACGGPAVWDQGAILVQHPQGLLSIAPTFPIVGGQQLLAMCVASGLALVHRKVPHRLALFGKVLAITFLAFTIRLAILTAFYVNAHAVLARDQTLALEMFLTPWTGLACVLAIAAVMARGDCEWAWFERADPIPSKWAATMTFVIAICGAYALGSESPGEPKRGRVLIDERLGNVWEPAARLLDKRRFGDFSTYSFSALTEQLSHRYAVTVNDSREYTEDLLAGFDVLIIKTPETDLSDREVNAIQRWIERGGGLFAISDHTDLLGMSTRLNQLVGPAGLQFRFDATNPISDPGLDWWRPPLIPEHPVSYSLPSMQLMTACSLQLGAGARPVLTLQRTTLQDGDYSKSSNFGTRPPNPSRPQGRAVIAGAAKWGRGRILAFCDSTVFSSFAFDLTGHRDFCLRSVAWLNRTNAVFDPVFVGMLGIALFSAAGIGWLMRARAVSVVGPLELCALALGVPLGSVIAVWVGANALDAPSLREDSSIVRMVVGGSGVALPPVLGSQPELEPGVNLATFATIPLRLGAEVEVVEPGGEWSLADTRHLIVLNPEGMAQDDSIQKWLSAVRGWVEEGHVLVVLVRRAHAGHEHDRSGAYTHDLSFRPVQLPCMPPDDTEVFVEAAPCGQGTVVRVVGSEAFDVNALGHCMSLPGKSSRRGYDLCYWLFESIMGVRIQSRSSYTPTLDVKR